jgi:cytoskeleton protein RodZ
MNDELTREEIDAEAGGPTSLRGTSDWQGAGAKLRQARERLNLSLEDVAAQIKTAPKKLTALEEEQWQSMPERPYLRGLVRNYARVVQLDPEPLLRSIDAAVGTSNRPQELSLKPALQAPFPHRPAGPHESPFNKLIAAGVLGCIVIIAALVLPGSPEFHRASTMVAEYLHRDSPTTVVAANTPRGEPAEAGAADRAAAADSVSPANSLSNNSTKTGASASGSANLPASTPQVASSTSQPVGSPTLAAVTATPSSMPSPTSATLAPSLTPSATLALNTSGSADANGAMTLQFRDDSWVEVRQADGKLLSSQIYHAGTEQSIEASTPVQIVIGNAPAVTLTYRGRPVDLDAYTRARVARLNLP